MMCKYFLYLYFQISYNKTVIIKSALYLGDYGHQKNYIFYDSSIKISFPFYDDSIFTVASHIE